MFIKNRRPRTISLNTEFKYATTKIESPLSNEPFSLEGPLKHGSSSSLLSYKGMYMFEVFLIFNRRFIYKVLKI